MSPVRHNAKQVRIDDAWLKIYQQRVVVWWYGPVEKNTKESSVPLVKVLFQCPDKTGERDKWLPRSIALTQLGLLRIGSMWSEGKCAGNIDRQVETFDVDFSDGWWSCASPASAVKHAASGSLQSTGYPFPLRYDPGYLLDFKLAGGKNLLVPCMEFFARCYGRSAEVKRVLATYRWEEAERRLYLPFDEQPPPGTWAVKLAKRMRNDDVVFLAHVKYDAYARSVAKTIYSQAEAAPMPRGPDKPYVFLRATPWFRGPAKLKVAGIPLNGGRSFLGLRILGASQPQGDAVIRDRENRGSLIDAGDPSGDEIGSGLPVKRLRSLPEILDLTGDEEPDHGSMSIDIEEDDFEILGEPRTVIDRKTAIERGLVRRVSGDGGIRSVSTGEPHGTGKGVGYGSIHAPVVLESQGALREIWRAARRLGDEYPESIRSVGWFTFNGGVSYDDEPKLIALTPHHNEANKVTSTWVYHDVAALTPRGVLVVVMEFTDATVYLLEIQRRTSTDNDSGEESEESFKGLAVAVQREQNPRQWLRRILHGIREKKGVVRKLVDKCPGIAYAYKHVASARVTAVPYEASVLNALAKVGLTIGAAPRQRSAPRGVS